MFLYLFKARKNSEEKPSPTTTPKKSSVSVPSKTSRTPPEDVISPSPQKSPAAVRASSKLAMMKKRDEAKDEGATSKTPTSPRKNKISPKKEPRASSISDMKFTPKAGTTPTALKTSPKKPEVMLLTVTQEAEL